MEHKLKSKYNVYSQIYLNEFNTLTANELKVLGFLRVTAGGENKITWYKKENMMNFLGDFGIKKLNNCIDSLEKKGAIIVFNVKDTKTKKQCSNIYYICEFNQSVGKGYITLNDMETILEEVKFERITKEKRYAKEHNIKARNFLIIPRLTKKERQVKFICEPGVQKETQAGCPKGNPEPGVQKGYPIINKKKLNNKNKLNNNNNKEEENKTIYKNENENVVVENGEVKKIKEIIETNLGIILDNKDIKNIILVLKKKNSCIDIKKLLSIVNILKANKNEIHNITGYIIAAIKKDYKVNSYKNNSLNKNDLKFNNFDQRTYDYDSLEKKLLGWECEE